MPGEYEPHRGCILIWPERPGSWRNGAREAKKAFAGGMTISVYEGLPLSSCLFEAASAVGTVGLTLGITPKLHILSQIILIILMYLGRVGGLTLIYAVFSDKNKRKAKLPLDKIIVG